MCCIGDPGMCSRVEISAQVMHNPTAQAALHNYSPSMACSNGCNLAPLHVTLVLSIQSFLRAHYFYFFHCSLFLPDSFFYNFPSSLRTLFSHSFIVVFLF